MDNTQAKANIQVLMQSDWWRLMCNYIDENIQRLDILINDDSAWCEENDKPLYSWRVLNIKQKKILQNLKQLPKKIIDNMTDQFVSMEQAEMPNIDDIF